MPCDISRNNERYEAGLRQVLFQLLMLTELFPSDFFVLQIMKINGSLLTLEKAACPVSGNDYLL